MNQAILIIFPQRLDLYYADAILSLLNIKCRLYVKPVFCRLTTFFNGVSMTVENQVRAIAGTFILTSLALSHYVHPYWIYFTVFVGANLLQSSFTKFCPLEIFLRKIQSAK